MEGFLVVLAIACGIVALALGAPIGTVLGLFFLILLIAVIIFRKRHPELYQGDPNADNVD